MPPTQRESRHMPPILRGIAMIVLGAGAACGPHAAPTRAPSRPAIFGGWPVTNGALPAVGALGFRSSASGEPRLLCTASLIAPDLLLTAGHCLQSTEFDAKLPNSDATTHLVAAFGPGEDGGRLPSPSLAVASATYHPMLRRHPLGYADFGLVRLQEPVAAIEPLPILSTLPATLGALKQGQAEIVGFGRREDARFGRKFMAAAAIRRWTPSEAVVGGDGRDGCDGDSGAPALVAGGILGVISRGLQLECGHGGYVGLAADAACWLQREAGATLGDLHADCGTASPPIYDDDALAHIDLPALCRASLASMEVHGPDPATAGSTSGTAWGTTQMETLRAISLGLAITDCDHLVATLQTKTMLILDGLRIADLSPLAPLSNLRYLSLIGNRLEDLGPLRRLRQLRVLHTEGNDIKDWRATADLERGGLKVYGRRRQLSTYFNTTFLRLCQASATGAAGQAVAAIMSQLAASSCATANERLLAARSLYLNGSALSDLTALSGLEQLESLSLADNPVVDLSPLAGLESLKYLDLRGTAAHDLKPLAALMDQGLVVQQ